MTVFPLLLLHIYLWLPSTHGFIPRACAANLTDSPVVCCPTPTGHQHPCGFPTRGQCVKVQGYRQILRKEQLFFEAWDIRFRWPTRIYQYTCRCNSAYWGPGCGECWFGYQGKRCDKRVIRKRRNIATYTAAERRRLVQIFMKTRKVKSEYVMPRMRNAQSRMTGKVIEVDPYELLTFSHFLGAIPLITKTQPMCNDAEIDNWDRGHTDSGFMVYHRYLMMMFEREMGKVAQRFFGLDNFALPYWDWTNSKQCDICTDDLIGTETREYNPIIKCHNISTASPFGTKKWPVYCQNSSTVQQYCRPCYLQHPGRLCRMWRSYNLPTVEGVIQALRLGKFQNRTARCAAFSYLLEQGDKCRCEWDYRVATLHNNIHKRTSGTMDPLASSIYDPLFLFHHVQVDRLFTRWFAAIQPSSTEFSNVNHMLPMCRDCYISSFFPLVRYRELFVDSRALGYAYDNLDFGSLSEKMRIAHWNSTYVPKHCERHPLFK